MSISNAHPLKVFLSLCIAGCLAAMCPDAQAAVGPRGPVGPIDSPGCPPSSVTLSPGDNVQHIVNGHPAGSVYCFAAGTYARQEIAPKTGDVFYGSKGAILDGEHAVKHAFYGSASNVTIENFVIRNYAAPPQDAPVNNRWGKGLNWVVRHNDISYNEGAGIEVGTGTQVLANHLHHNRQEGYACGGDNVVISDNEIDSNNPDDLVKPNWEAGGGKCWSTTGLKVIYNYAHDNHGPGLWTDNDNQGTDYEYNLVENNWGGGIYHEISWDGVIAHNVARNNANTFYCKAWLWCSSIQVNSSGGLGNRILDIYDNTVSSDGRQHGNAIGLMQQKRGDGLLGPRLVQNVHVHNNRVDLSGGGLNGAAVDNGDDAVFNSRGNFFDHNAYVSAGKNSFSWNHKNSDFRWFQSQGQELHGVLQ